MNKPINTQPRSSIKPRSGFRFPLKRLLLGMTLACGLVAFVVQRGTELASFQLVASDLSLDESGLVEGELRCLFITGAAPTRGELVKFEVQGVSNQAMLDLDDKPFRFRYRHQPIWPIKKQDPYVQFIEQKLGIDRAMVLGFVTTDQETTVVINGRSELKKSNR